MDAELARLDPDDTWLHADRIEWPYIDVKTPGLPPGLADLLEEWIGLKAPLEQIAAVAGWPIDRVKELM
jgi:hypothetical protein